MDRNYKKTITKKKKKRKKKKKKDTPPSTQFHLIELKAIGLQFCTDLVAKTGNKRTSICLQQAGSYILLTDTK